MATRSLTVLLSQRGFLNGKVCQGHAGLAAVSASVLRSPLHGHGRFLHSDSVRSRGSNGCGRPLTCGGRWGHHGLQAWCSGVSAAAVGGLLQQIATTPTTPPSWSVVRGYAKKAKKEKVAKGGKKKVTLSGEELEGVLDLHRLQKEMKGVADDLKQQMMEQVSLRTNIGAYDKLPVRTEDGVFPLVQLGQVVQKSPALIMVNMAATPQYTKEVKDALSQSGLNINPQQDGTTIFIAVPKVTREHREGLARNAKAIHDKAKTRLRDIHNKYVKKVRAAKDHHSEDIVRAAQDMVLEEMHGYGQQLDSVLAAKQQELLGDK